MWKWDEKNERDKCRYHLLSYIYLVLLFVAAQNLTFYKYLQRPNITKSHSAGNYRSESREKEKLLCLDHREV